ncbi:MAG: AAC(3) family N-acetyltransferase, partial [Pontixanthobacter sp.]
VGIHEHGLAFIYTDLRSFGQAAAQFESREAFFRAIVDPLLQKGLTVLIPTFTYTTQGRFDIDATPSRLGAINKWMSRHPGALRSAHPLFSVAAIGPHSDIVQGIGKSAFGADGIFERMRNRNAAFLHVGRPVAIGNTCVHYVEQMCGATYRYQKAFDTEVYRGDLFVGTDYTALVRRRDVEGCDFDFGYRQDPATLAEGLGIREVGSNADFTNISCYDYDRTIEFFIRSFYADPNVFIRETFLERD